MALKDRFLTLKYVVTGSFPKLLTAPISVYVDNRVFPMDIPSTSWYNDRLYSIQKMETKSYLSVRR